MNRYHFVLSARLAHSQAERALLKQKGLDYFEVFFSPAAGPRYFATAGFERAFLRTKTTSTKYFVAASAGALRFVTLLCSKYAGRDMNAEFEKHLCEFSIARKDTPERVGTNLAKLFEGYTHNLVEQILNDSQHRVCVFVSKLHPWVSEAPKYAQLAAFAGGILANYAHPGSQKLLYKRLCFYTGDVPAPSVFQVNDEVEFHPLTHDNFHRVLLATAAIPFRVQPPTDMPGLGKGLYVDGGLGDYMINSHVHSRPALLLSHTARVAGTWMDSIVPYRRLPSHIFDHTSVLYPSEEFVKALPDAKLPGVSDWDKYRLNPQVRIEKWQACIQRALESFPQNPLTSAKVVIRPQHRALMNPV